MGHLFGEVWGAGSGMWDWSSDSWRAGGREVEVDAVV